ncbi:hypothetical protein [Coralloluteibacterium stylophorae]|uniref:Uncharacterized protein n=1 Tax=Coralloluteibacterium stylophorae TaxID=1776034 RepID=A0A8J7VS98_9GAMM|nr:hypothetical protein [Coralloluteibacterium stylophorae]MBS7456702.1 hypothetical protein [Coralloluteibacterium stylophorae]
MRSLPVLALSLVLATTASAAAAARPHDHRDHRDRLRPVEPVVVVDPYASGFDDCWPAPQAGTVVREPADRERGGVLAVSVGGAAGAVTSGRGVREVSTAPRDPGAAPGDAGALAPVPCGAPPAPLR